MEFLAHLVDPLPVDAELTDAGTVGPELAHLAGVYLRSPRALIWQNPSPEWRLFVLLPPLASRLSLLANPVFAQLTRAWGLNLRFIGVDRDGLVHDFRNLLANDTLRLAVRLLGAEAPDARPLLDALFEAMARDLMTLVRERRAGWGRHLDLEHRLEPMEPGTLFARESRYPDFLGSLRAALRDDIIDTQLYGRALRALEQRELATETRTATRIEAALEPETFARLAATGAGHHLGAYNWLMLGARHAASRAHVLTRLPGFAAFLAQSLVPLDAARIESGDPGGEDTEPARQPPTLDLRALAVPAPNALWSAALQRAIDAGQDRAVIEALAQRFSVDANLLRRLWREIPAGLGQPPAWQLGPILRRLDTLGAREWPASAAHWQALIAAADGAPG